MEKKPKALTSEAREAAISQGVLAVIDSTGKEQVVHQSSTGSSAHQPFLWPSDARFEFVASWTMKRHI